MVDFSTGTCYNRKRIQPRKQRGNMGRPKKEKPNRKDGCYEIKASVGTADDGTPIRKSFYSTKSKEDARRKAEQYKVQQELQEQTGICLQKNRTLFSTWAREWLETYKKGKVKDQTYYFTYQVNVEKYLIPFFGAMRLQMIRQIDVQRYFNTVQNAETGAALSASVLDKHKMILSAIFHAAIDNDLCFKNPVKNIKITSKPKQERHVYTAEQAKIAEQYAMKHGRYDIVLLMHTGLRRSELLGLQWSDLDFEKKLLHIQRAVTQTKGGILIDKPKTKTSIRDIPISDFVVAILEKMERTGCYVIAGKHPNEPMKPHTYADHFSDFMKRMQKETGLPSLTPHELRHTFGTLLRENDVDIYTIQKVLGHSDITVTSNIYVHNDIEVLRKRLKVDEK